jgi:hypothetical protein
VSDDNKIYSSEELDKIEIELSNSIHNPKIGKFLIFYTFFALIFIVLPLGVIGLALCLHMFFWATAIGIYPFMMIWKWEFFNMSYAIIPSIFIQDFVDFKIPKYSFTEETHNIQSIIQICNEFFLVNIDFMKDDLSLVCKEILNSNIILGGLLVHIICIAIGFFILYVLSIPIMKHTKRKEMKSKALFDILKQNGRR